MEEAEIKELLAKAEEQFQNKDYDSTLGSVEAVIKEDEDDTKAWFIKGQVFKMRGDLLEAQRCFDRGLASDLNNERLWLAKADVLISLNRIEEAKRSLNRALKIKPGYADANITKGRLLLRTREFNQALDSFQNILKSQPDNAEAWIGKGNTLFMGFAEPKGGIESMLKAIDVDRDNVGAWMNVGVIHRSERQYEKAIAAFNEVLKIDTENKEAQKYRDFCIRKISNELSTEEAKALSYTSSWDNMVEDAKNEEVEEESDEESPASWDDVEEVDEEVEEESNEESPASWDDVEEEVEEESNEESPASWDDVEEEAEEEEEEIKENEDLEEDTSDIPDLDTDPTPSSWDSAEEVDDEPEEESVSSWDDTEEVEEEDKVSSWDSAEEINGDSSISSWDSAEEVTEGRYVEIIELNCPKCGNQIKGKKEGEGPIVVECDKCGASGVIR